MNTGRKGISASTVDRMCSRYVAGETIAEIAPDFGVSPSLIHYYLNKRRINARPAKRRLVADEATRAEIVSCYLSGTSADDTAQRFGVSANVIRSAVKMSGHPMRDRNAPKRRIIAVQNQVVARYEQLKDLNGVGKEFGISGNAVEACLLRTGKRPQTVSEARTIYTVNHAVFDEVNEHSAYWAGFLMADGCVGISAGRKAVIQLPLAQKDKDHLKKYGAFLQTDKPINHWISKPRMMGKWLIGASPGCGLAVASDRIASALGRFGVVPRKTYIAKAMLLENDRHFWRGVIDGDGAVMWCGQTETYCGEARISLVGSFPLLNQFADFVLRVVGKRPNVKPKYRVATVSVCCYSAFLMMKHLYEHCAIALDRKRDKALWIIQQYEISQRRPARSSSVTSARP